VEKQAVKITKRQIDTKNKKNYPATKLIQKQES